MHVTADLFLQTDPIPGGSANAYDYVDQDPINGYDLAGTWHIHWRSVFKVAAIVGGIAGAVACGATVVCGAIVGAAAAAAAYSASNAGTSHWSWSGFGIQTAVGGLSGGVFAKLAGAVGRIDTDPMSLGAGRMLRIHADEDVHPMGLFGNRSHLQFNTWTNGVKGSDSAFRIPLPRSWF